MPRWAAISGYMALMSTGAGSVRRGLLRLSDTIAGGGTTTRHLVAEKSFHRFMGCLPGGIVARGCLALQVESFLCWLAMIGGLGILMIVSLLLWPSDEALKVEQGT